MQKTKIALFPLQMFLLPGEKGKLHIFEERYKQLLEDCREPGTSFGIPFTQNGYLSGFGCIVEVTEVMHMYPNGSADIEIQCIDLFKLSQFFMKMGEKPYPGGEIIPIADRVELFVSKALQKMLDDYIREVEPEKLPAIMDPQINVYDVAQILELSEDDKIKIVKSKTLESKERVLINQLKMLRALQKQKNSIQDNVFLN